MDFISRKDGVDKKKIREYFKNFHAAIPQYMQKVKKLLGKDEIDFSMEEIDQVGLIYKNNFSSPEALDLSYDHLLDLFLAYCCEAWVHYFGGEYFDTLSPKDICYGYPQVVEWGPEKFGWIGLAPNEWAFQIEEGRKQEPLSTLFSKYLNRFRNSEEYNFKTKK